MADSSQGGVIVNPSMNGPQVLELRVHGIKNTAPHVLLDCDVGAIEPVGDSDALSGFWEKKLRRQMPRPGLKPALTTPGCGGTD